MNEEIIGKLNERLEDLKEIYRENEKTDYDSGRVAGFKEAIELVQEMRE